MSVLASVTEALSGCPGEEWQRAIALALAEQMDSNPNASTAKELRALMGDLGVSSDGVKKGDVSDDLASKRAARRSAAG